MTSTAAISDWKYVEKLQIGLIGLGFIIAFIALVHPDVKGNVWAYFGLLFAGVMFFLVGVNIHNLLNEPTNAEIVFFCSVAFVYGGIALIHPIAAGVIALIPGFLFVVCLLEFTGVLDEPLKRTLHA